MGLSRNVGVAGALAKKLINRLVHYHRVARTPSQTPLGGKQSAEFENIQRNISIYNAKPVKGEPFGCIHVLLRGKSEIKGQNARSSFGVEEYRFVRRLYIDFDVKRDVQALRYPAPDFGDLEGRMTSLILESVRRSRGDHGPGHRVDEILHCRVRKHRTQRIQTRRIASNIFGVDCCTYRRAG